MSSDSEEYEEWVESGSSIDDVDIYNDTDSDKDEESQLQQHFEFKEGDFVLVSFPGKKRSHLYACIIQNNFNQYEAQVMALNYCNEAKTVFRRNEMDVSVVNTNQIVEKLDTPKIVCSTDRVRYEFSCSLRVDG